MKTVYTDWAPRTQGTKDLLVHALGIIEDYAGQGIQLTIRQLYYRLVAGGVLENNHKRYKGLISLIGNARMAGFIDWDSIVDRGRVVNKPPEWDGPASILGVCPRIRSWRRKPPRNNLFTVIWTLSWSN